MDLAYSAGFESYGTRLLLRSNDKDTLDDLIMVTRSALLGDLRPCKSGTYQLVLDLVGSKDNYEVFRNAELITKGRIDPYSSRYLNALIRLSVAEFSRHLVFLHAGAVGWKGKGIVLPAMSFQGKSTLVYELVKLGAEYYSDDFAILDAKGRLHPFPRDISLRSRHSDGEPHEIDPQLIGATVGSGKIPVGLIFLTRYKPRSHWAPKRVSRGEGIFDLLPFTLPIRQKPHLALEVLNTAAAPAVIAKSMRADAKIAAKRLLEFFDKVTF